MDTSNPIPLIRAIIPKVPLIGKTTLQHTLGFSEHSKHWDLRTALTVNILRSFIVDSPPEPISKTQHMTLKDPGIKGRLWVSKVVLKRPVEEGVWEGLKGAIESTKEEGETPGGFTEPGLVDVEAEWVGYRAGATPNSTELRISEADKYTELMKEVTSPTTVLYFHGGAYYLLDPITYRLAAKKLAKLTKGRVLNVRYRLAPQNPFPAALLDALVSYLSLLYPLPGAFHTPVEARHIVFAGDSAGGNLCLVLLQTILEFKRTGTKILWNGEEREVPVPGGAALSSPWADITRSCPSCSTNGSYDYLPPMGADIQEKVFPPCEIWPANPPRNNIYVEDVLMAHPLVSPLGAKSWEGSCAVWVSVGTELLTDEGRIVTNALYKDSVPVIYEESETMPHVFAMMLEGTPIARRFYTGITNFIIAATTAPETIVSKGIVIKPKTLEEVSVDLGTLSTLSGDEVRARMRESAKKMGQKKIADPISKL